MDIGTNARRHQLPASTNVNLNRNVSMVTVRQAYSGSFDMITGMYKCYHHYEFKVYSGLPMERMRNSSHHKNHQHENTIIL